MITFLPVLDDISLAEAGEFLLRYTPVHTIGCCNWAAQFPEKPLAQFAIARSSKAFVIAFRVTETDVLAEHSESLSAVAQDSCVEWFVQIPGSQRYWNFEFNAIGTVNASHRETRPEPTRLTLEQIATIGRHSTLGNEPFGLRRGRAQWTLSVAIPFRLLFSAPYTMPTYLLGNFYCCGGAKPQRHYLSWAPIKTDRPDFHRPDFFAPIAIEPL